MYRPYGRYYVNVLWLIQIYNRWKRKKPVASLFEHTLVAAFLLQVFKNKSPSKTKKRKKRKHKSPSLWWIPMVWPLYTSILGLKKRLLLSWQLKSAYEVVGPMSKETCTKACILEQVLWENIFLGFYYKLNWVYFAYFSAVL